MVIEFLSICESFATMITFILSIIWMDMCLLNMSFFSSHWNHQATNFTRNSAMCPFNMVIEMIFSFAHFGTLGTFLRIQFMMDPVMSGHTGDLFATQIAYFQLVIGLRFSDFMGFVPMVF